MKVWAVTGIQLSKGTPWRLSVSRVEPRRIESLFIRSYREDSVICEKPRHQGHIFGVLSRGIWKSENQHLWY
jgi:hypothetical protein